MGEWTDWTGLGWAAGRVDGAREQWSARLEQCHSSWSKRREQQRRHLDEEGAAVWRNGPDELMAGGTRRNQAKRLPSQANKNPHSQILDEASADSI